MKAREKHAAAAGPGGGVGQNRDLQPVPRRYPEPYVHPAPIPRPPPHPIPHPCRHPARKEPVTILVGIIYGDGIIVATDSQSSYAFSSKKECDKISVVNLGKDQVIIAQSGVSVWAKRLVEIIQEKATMETRIKGPRFVADIAEKAVEDLKEKLKYQEQKDYLKENGITLLLAFMFGVEPFLYILDVFLGVAEKVDGKFASAGCGTVLADHLLNELIDPKKELLEGPASVIAAYIVDKVKKYDTYCGGETKMACVKTIHIKERTTNMGFNASQALVLFPGVIADLEQGIPTIDAAISNARKKVVDEIIENVAKKSYSS